MLEATARRNMLDTSVSGRDLPLLRKALAIPAPLGPARESFAPSTRGSNGEGFSLGNKLAEAILNVLGFVCKGLSRPASNFFWND
jgi:hypothetical protein